MLICEKCGGKSGVIDSRGARRRRVCQKCGWRWSTLEVSAARTQGRSLEPTRENAERFLQAGFMACINSMKMNHNGALIWIPDWSMVRDAVVDAALAEEQR